MSPVATPESYASLLINSGGLGVSNTLEVPNNNFIPAFVCLIAGRSDQIVIHGFVGFSGAYSLE